MLDFFPKRFIGYSPFGGRTWGEGTRCVWMGDVLAHVVHDVLHGWEGEDYNMVLKLRPCLLSLNVYQETGLVLPAYLHVRYASHTWCDMTETHVVALV